MKARTTLAGAGAVALAAAAFWMPGARAQYGGAGAGTSAPPPGAPAAGWRCPMAAGGGVYCPMAGAGAAGSGMGVISRLGLTPEQQRLFLQLREKHRAQMQALWASNLPADQLQKRALELRQSNRQEMVRALKLTPEQAKVLESWQASRPGPGMGYGMGLGMGARRRPGSGGGQGAGLGGGFGPGDRMMGRGPGAGMGAGLGMGPGGSFGRGAGIGPRMTLPQIADRIASVPALADKRAQIASILGPAAQAEARLLQSLKDPAANALQIRTQIRSLHQDAMSQVAALLTPAQRAALRDAVRAWNIAPGR